MLGNVLTISMLIILSTVWIFISCIISFFTKKFLRLHIRGSNLLWHVLPISLLIEVAVSILFLLFSPSLSKQPLPTGKAASYIVRGYYAWMLLLPLSTAIGVAAGLKKRAILSFIRMRIRRH
jgi:magnesium-transporting ATPase (P-type)